MANKFILNYFSAKLTADSDLTNKLLTKVSSVDTLRDHYSKHHSNSYAWVQFYKKFLRAHTTADLQRENTLRLQKKEIFAVEVIRR